MKRVVHSRCYVNFEDPSDIPAFKAAVEAHAFVTDRGAQFRGCVEYAPFQKVPQGKPKRDPREGTLEKGVLSCHPSDVTNYRKSSIAKSLLDTGPAPQADAQLGMAWFCY